MKNELFMKKDIIENVFKDLFEDFESEVTSVIWLNIENVLALNED
jgi:hypothetical protein